MSGKLVKKPRYLVVKKINNEILYSFYSDDDLLAIIDAEEWIDVNNIESTDCELCRMTSRKDIKEYETLEDVLTGYKVVYGWDKKYDVIKQKDDSNNKNVNHPKHYNQNKDGKETIEEIRESMSDEEYKGFLKGNIIKYISRCEYKGKELEDLQKAKWYLDKLIILCEKN